MTREQVLKLFPEATEEQITNLLNQSNAELEKEKTNHCISRRYSLAAVTGN